MKIPFFKYQGTGNDFVMIDDRANSFPVSTELIAHLCHRRFGIGADGLILLRNHANYDFEMVYFNADGNEGSMCGNGGRCTVRFAHDLGIFESETRFLAVDGEHLAVACEDEIFLKMGEVTELEQHPDYDFMNTGSPHFVKYVEDINGVDVFQEGEIIRYSPEWQARGGTNVNFVQLMQNNTLFVRTYERGVEDETYSCGTGVTACAIAAHLRFGMNEPIQIITKGGNLRVSFAKNGEQIENIFLIGPAEKVFEGEIN